MSNKLSDALPASPGTRDKSVDLLTVISIAIVAYCITNVVHEGLGHGYGCILGGGRPQFLNAIFFSCEDSGMSAAGKRILAAGGSVANLMLAGAAFLALKLWKAPSSPTHYFLWLLLALNVLMPFGYLLFSGIGGFGDWAAFIDGFRPAILYRGVLIALGAFLYFAVASRILMPGLSVYLGRDPARREGRVKLVALTPYLTGGITFVMAGLLNPHGLILVLLSAAAASFGGTSWLAWYPGGRRDTAPEADARTEPASIPRSFPWMIAGGVTLVLFVAVLGPGIKL